ncbi:MAG: T9SS type A sorting domain-containing protein [Sphingobacteriales bacterium]|nr:MAG: T9SS type A sorting domain-containing protein [Sphingobacteriales bacterium]
MACPSSGPDGIIVNDTLYSVFRSSASGQRVYLGKSTLSGQQLVSSSKIIPDFTGLSSQDFPRIAHSGNAAAIAWKQVSGGVAARAVVAFTSNIHNGFADYDTVGISGVTNVDVAMKAGEIHVIWENDATGTVMYSKGTYSTTTVPSVAAPAPIAVFPNPASKCVTIPVADVKSCTMTDVVGKQFTPTMTTASGMLHVFVDALPTGVYTISVTDMNGQQFYAKISVE